MTTRTAGRPIDWYTRTSHHDPMRTRMRKEINERLVCSVPGCEAQRKGLSTMCNRHALRMRNQGDPIATQPTMQQLDTFKETIKQVRKSDPKAEALVKQELSFQVRSYWQRPYSWAARAVQFHKRLTTQAKAEIIKAHLRKNEIDLEPLFVHALAMEGWMRTNFDGLPRYRQRFLETQIGKWCTRRGTPKQSFNQTRNKTDTTMTYYGPNGPFHPILKEDWVLEVKPYLSGTVERRLGADTLKGARRIFGRDWWEQEALRSNEVRASLQREIHSI